MCMLERSKGYYCVLSSRGIIYKDKMSGKRDSDSRPRPWQGRALPTELLPHYNRSEEKETRTPTTQLSLPPQSSASTNSAISPNCWKPSGAQNRTRTCTTLLSLVPETSASTIPPPGLSFYNKNERQTRLGLATSTLARLRSTNWAIAALILHFSKRDAKV